MEGKSPAVVLTALALLVGLPLSLVLLIVITMAAEEEEQASATSCAVTAVPASTSTDEKGGGGTGPGLAGVPNGWGPLIEAAAREAGLPANVLAAQLNQESGWNPKATSHAGAQGLAQFMPATWATYGNGGDPFDPEDAIAAQGRYMGELKKQVQPIAGDDPDQLVRLTLAAYNAGPGAVQKAKGIPPFHETQDYVQKILGGGQSNYSMNCAAGDGATSWDGDLGPGKWTTPLPNSQLTGGGAYGARNVPGLPAWAQQHAGLDFATGSSYGDGGPVVTPTAMKVVAIYAPDGCVQTRLTSKDDPAFGMGFCHLNKINVKVGQTLQRGDIIGVEGNKATSVGTQVITHLHFELYKPDVPDAKLKFPNNGYTIDPDPILKEKGALP